MFKGDFNGGLLSKVIKFMRHPATTWANLNTRNSDIDEEQNRAALKAVMARKRRNDFVRKREFEMLRKIHDREVSAYGSHGVPPSLFQSSSPFKSDDDRVSTLKKIDEIEAQMSMQWWKTKGPDSLITVGSTLIGGIPASVRSAGIKTPVSKGLLLPSNAPSSQILSSKNGGGVSPDFAKAGFDFRSEESAMPGGPAPLRRNPQPKAASIEPAVAVARSSSVEAFGFSHLSGSSIFSDSDLLALDVHEIVQNPDIEEAAIRFANNDFVGAEQGLLHVLSGGDVHAHRMDVWLALFDLYRATGQLASFESQALDFMNRFGRSPPQWVDMPSEVSAQTGQRSQPLVANLKVVWACEAELDAHAVGALQKVLMRVSQPWVIDWTSLESIDLNAARALLDMFSLWGGQNVELRFLSETKIIDFLTRVTPSGAHDVDQLWWELRLAALRLMNRPDEFEVAALDFCLTYEVSPPGWEAPLCHVQAMGVDVAEGEAGNFVLSEIATTPEPLADSVGKNFENSIQESNELGLVELTGLILGDPQEVVKTLDDRLQDRDEISISCRNLIRVDFSAAGALLNWVSGQHAQGHMVQFVEVHRLVAAFFHVIGITEYATVVLRSD